MAAGKPRTRPRLAALLGLLSAVSVSGCLTSVTGYSYSEAMTITITPSRADVPYAIWLPALFTDNQSNPDFEPLGVAPPSQDLRATSGAATLTFEANETYWRFLRVDATGPVVLGSKGSGHSQDIRQTEAYGSYGWTAGRDEDTARGSTRPDEILVGVQSPSTAPFDLRVIVERSGRSDYCSLQAGFNGTAAPPTDAAIHWQWLPGSAWEVCT